MSLSELRRSFHRVKLSDRDVALSTLHEQGYIICERSLSKTSSKIITIYRISNTGDQYIQTELNFVCN